MDHVTWGYKTKLINHITPHWSGWVHTGNGVGCGWVSKGVILIKAANCVVANWCWTWPSHKTTSVNEYCIGCGSICDKDSLVCVCLQEKIYSSWTKICLMLAGYCEQQAYALFLLHEHLYIFSPKIPLLKCKSRDYDLEFLHSFLMQNSAISKQQSIKKQSDFYK